MFISKILNCGFFADYSNSFLTTVVPASGQRFPTRLLVPADMDSAYLSTPDEALKNFSVLEDEGLSDTQVRAAIAKYGRNGTVHHQDAHLVEVLLI